MMKFNSRGFTLIEVMISMAILAILSILTAQTMRTGLIDRESISNTIARESKATDALRIIRTDINAAFHYRDIYITIMNNAAKADAAPGTEPGQPPADPSQPPPIVPPVPPPVTPGTAASEPVATPRPTPVDLTGFIGDGESVYFTTLANTRTIQDSQQSDQAKVGYYVKSCKAKSGQKIVATKCLFRSTTPFLDEDIEKPGEETVLLEHVDQFKLRYLGPGHDDLEYVDTWKTGKNGDANTKENFPYAVEVTLTTEDKDDKKGGGRVVASALIPIRFPNNPPVKKPGQPGAATDPSNPANPSLAPQGGKN